MKDKKTLSDVKISVIIPMYNAERFVGKCIESIQEQTLKDIEIICVDDGSNDDTAKIVAAYSDNDSRIILKKEKHRSAGAARNIGIEIARGKYLAILDVDDNYHQDMLMKMYESAENNYSDVVVCLSGEIDEKTGRICSAVDHHVKKQHLPQSGVFNAGSFKRSISFYYIFVGWAWDKLFRADFINDNGIRFQDQRSINDLLFVYSALSKADRITLVEESLVDKRICMNGSISSEYERSKHWEDFLNALYSLRIRIEEWGLGDKLWKDYINYSVFFTLYNLGRFVQSEVFSDIVNALKGNWGEKIGIKGCTRDIIYNEMDYEMINLVLNLDADEIRMLMEVGRSNEHFLFPYELVEKGSDIVLYSAGRVGRAFYLQLISSKYCNIKAWVDKNPALANGGLISGLDVLGDTHFDKVVIAVADYKIAQNIRNDLRDRGIDNNKIVWRSPRYA